MSRKGIFLGNFLFSAFNYSLYLLMGLLISALGTSLSAGGRGASSALAPAGSPQPRPPAGVCVPSAEINREVINLKNCNTLFLALLIVLQSFSYFGRLPYGEPVRLLSSIPVTGNSETRAALLSLRSFAQFFPF
ncbi:hypothetical protein QF028_003854 [Neobacillus sp. B4I6]